MRPSMHRTERSRGSPEDEKEHGRKAEKDQQAATPTAASTALSAAPHERPA